MALGLVALGSCVDDNESQSVTNIRNAKAEQLQAMAALANAQADAATITANAEAAYKTALAAYQNALAAGKENETEEAKQRFAAELQNIQLRAQLEMEQLKLQIEQEKAAAANWQIQNASSELKNLYNRYASEVSVLANLNQMLASAKSNLVMAENNLVSAEAYNKAQILNWQNSIATYEAQLEVLNSDKYAGLDVAELRAQAQAKYKEYTLAQTAFSKDPTCDALLNASKATDAAYEAFQKEEEALNDLQSMYVFGSVMTNGEYKWISEPVYSVVGFNANTSDYISTSVYEGASLSQVNKIDNDNYYEHYADYAAAALGESTDKADATDPNTGVLTAYAQLAAANDQLKAANDQMTEANKMPEKTDAEKEAKKAAVEAAQNAIDSANRDVEWVKENVLAPAQKNYDNAAEVQKKYADAVAAFDAEAYTKAVDALVAAAEAQDEAYEAWNEAKESVNDLWAEYAALDWMANNNATDVKQQIANLERNIANLKAQIANTEANINSNEVAVENAQKEIESLENQIAAQEKVVDAAKAALDAEINADAE